MKNTIITLTFCLFVYPLFAQRGWTDHTRVLPDILRKVPVALTIYHNPNPNFPELSDSKDWKYVWKHSTFLRSEMEDLEVVSMGSFIWYSEQGWMPNMEYNKEEVDKYFGCKKGILKKRKTYVFQKNYRFGNDLYGGDALWYVLAKDKNGKIYKGIGLIETESEVK